MSIHKNLAMFGLAIAISFGMKVAACHASDWQDRLESAIRYEMESKKLPAFSIAVVEDQVESYAKGFGFRDAEGKVPADAETIYRVGSVSKLFTDMAIMQMVEQGELELDKPIREWIPDLPNSSPLASGITLRQLMSHRSGLVRESPIGNYFDPNEPSLKETIRSLNSTKLTYPTDSKTKYSNAGIAVVGLVLEEKLKRPFEELIADKLLQPLKMTQSGFVRNQRIDEKLATAWMWTYDGRRFEAPKFLLGTGPAGNMYSNVHELGFFLKFLFRSMDTDPTHRIESDLGILSPTSLKAMMTPRLEANGKPQGFGIGFRVSELDGHRKIGHGGAVYGFSTQLEALPDDKVGVVAVGSLDGCNAVVERLTSYALRLVLAKRNAIPLPEYQQTEPIPLPRLREMVGEYENEMQFASISEFQGKAYLDYGSFRYEIRADRKTGQVMTDDPNGVGLALQWNEAGNLLISKKEFRRKTNQIPKEIPESWRGLIGEYGWDHNTLYILEEHGSLVALIEWFYKYPLKQISENEFAFPETGLYHGEKLKFIRGTHQKGLPSDATEVVAAEVSFPRREVGTKNGETFKIKPLKPIDELKAIAMSESPPKETGTFRDSELVELIRLDPTIRLDIRYASTNNFTGSQFYQQSRAFLQRPAAEAVVRIHQKLKKDGLGLMIHDAYRPWLVTKMFWEATPTEMRNFVANPAKGSRHNRGCAVDLTLFDLQTGEPIPMVAGYDEFSNRSFPQYSGGTSRQRWYRERLRNAMEEDGFKVYEFEWWHFDYQDWKEYRIGNSTFEELSK